MNVNYAKFQKTFDGRTISRELTLRGLAHNTRNSTLEPSFPKQCFLINCYVLVVPYSIKVLESILLVNEKTAIFVETIIRDSFPVSVCPIKKSADATQP